MTFNLWHGGDAGKQPLFQTIAVIKAANADIVGLQETHGYAPNDQSRPDRAAEIAKALNWNYLDQGDRTGIITRFEIIDTTPRKWGVTIKLPSEKTVHHFNAHFAASPYQPYQLLNIPYGNAPFIKTEAEAIRFANTTRQRSVQAMLGEINALPMDTHAVFITGDFNEPSCLDWTAQVVRAGNCPIQVDWPTTRRVLKAGFQDGYRQLHPDPLKRPGITWTPLTRPEDPKDHHDRIDFVFVRQDEGTTLKEAAVVGEAKDTSDIVVHPYPSDHRAVVVEVKLN